MNTMRELKEELKKTSAGRKFIEEEEPCEDVPDTNVGNTSYSQSQIDEAEEVKAIPVERLRDFRNAVMNMNSIAIIQRLDKLIEEVEE